MTQEEAIKFLSNTKVFVKNKSEEIQKKLFEIGFIWHEVPNTEPKYVAKPFLYMCDNKNLTYGNDVKVFYSHTYKEISAEDILNIKVEHLPKTWEEFCENNPIKAEEAIVTAGIIPITPGRTRFLHSDKCVLPNAAAAKAHRALMQLHQLRDCYRGNVDPVLCCYYSIMGGHNPIIVRDASRFLSFPTKEIAEEFLNNFKDLIEEAGDLI